MPLQQISVSPLDWSKETTNIQRRQDHWKIPEPVFTTSGSNPLERCPSQASTLSNNNDICRICHCEGEEDAPLIAPCYCAGSLRYVHQACLQQWIKSSDIRSCELCKFQFIMQSKLKPVNQWESLDMSGVERRKLLCSVLFHAVALTCVVWSLYVLVDRTADEVRRGALEWPFWTKLVVVVIGFTGGIVFMYIQCKAYIHLCRRWRAFNRVIYVQNVPEKVALPPPLPPPRSVGHEDSSFVSESCCGVTRPPPAAPIVVHSGAGKPSADKLQGRTEIASDVLRLDLGARDDVRIAMGAEGETRGGRYAETSGADGEETSLLLDGSSDGFSPRSRSSGGIQVVPAAGSSKTASVGDAFEATSVQIVEGRGRSATRASTEGAAERGAVRPATAPELQAPLLQDARYGRQDV